MTEGQHSKAANRIPQSWPVGMDASRRHCLLREARHAHIKSLIAAFLVSCCVGGCSGSPRGVSESAYAAHNVPPNHESWESIGFDAVMTGSMYMIVCDLCSYEQRDLLHLAGRTFEFGLGSSCEHMGTAACQWRSQPVAIERLVEPGASGEPVLVPQIGCVEIVRSCFELKGRLSELDVARQQETGQLCMAWYLKAHSGSAEPYVRIVLTAALSKANSRTVAVQCIAAAVADPGLALSGNPRESGDTIQWPEDKLREEAGRTVHQGSRSRPAACSVMEISGNQGTPYSFLGRNSPKWV
jgi:hypothetical protein